MKTNIFIPSKINVGFQNRKDTYTGKLAYVIYFDEKGKLRKETSWNSWRDEKIPNEIYDNEPTEGFVLNKKSGGVEESWGHNARRTYTRVYDPRGFEFEITIPNLLWILENCNCIKGKGLEGEFVYGWDGKDLVLVPVESPDYKEIQEKNKVIHNNEFIKAKDLIVGATYENLQGERFVYMGRFDKYQHESNYYYEASRYSCRKEGYEHELDETWVKDILLANSKTRYRFVNKGLHFFFVKLKNPDAKYTWEGKYDTVVTFKTLNKKLSKLTNKDYKYINFVGLLNKCKEYSPIDYSKNTIVPLPFENFKKVINEKIKEMTDRRYFPSFYIGIMNENGELDSKTIDYDLKEQKFYTNEKRPYEHKFFYGTETRYENYREYYESVEDLYQKNKPVYGEYYLENGYLHKRSYYYGTEE